MAMEDENGDFPPIDTNISRRLFDKRVILLSEAIHSVSAKRVIEQLLALDAADSKKEIWLFLNSPGGEVSSGFGIYDTMRFIQAPVKVIVTGLAASIATIILLGAPKAFRFALPNARLLIHQPLIQGMIRGQASDIDIHAKEILRTRSRIAEMYQQETGQPLERVQKDIERDHWMSVEEAKEYGLITKIVTKWSDALA
jgi:ATP-dependent Clp protease protease subunit